MGEVNIKSFLPPPISSHKLSEPPALNVIKETFPLSLYQARFQSAFFNQVYFKPN